MEKPRPESIPINSQESTTPPKSDIREGVPGGQSIQVDKVNGESRGIEARADFKTDAESSGESVKSWWQSAWEKVKNLDAVQNLSDRVSIWFNEKNAVSWQAHMGSLEKVKADFQKEVEANNEIILKSQEAGQSMRNIQGELGLEVDREGAGSQSALEKYFKKRDKALDSVVEIDRQIAEGKGKREAYERKCEEAQIRIASRFDAKIARNNESVQNHDHAIFEFQEGIGETQKHIDKLKEKEGQLNAILEAPDVASEYKDKVLKTLKEIEGWRRATERVQQGYREKKTEEEKKKKVLQDESNTWEKKADASLKFGFTQEGELKKKFKEGREERAFYDRLMLDRVAEAQSFDELSEVISSEDYIGGYATSHLLEEIDLIRNKKKKLEYMPRAWGIRKKVMQLLKSEGVAIRPQHKK